jgi:hypothetical protein
VTDDKQQDQQHEDDSIEGKALGGSFRIPVDRKDIGPHIKWLIISAAASLLLIAAAFAWSLIQCLIFPIFHFEINSRPLLLCQECVWLLPSCFESGSPIVKSESLPEF